MVKEINDSSFKTEVLDETSLPVLVDFWASWCGPCRMMASVVDEMEKVFTGKLKVLKLNTEQNHDTTAKYSITGIPCLIVFKNGKELNRLVGYRPVDTMESELKRILA